MPEIIKLVCEVVGRNYVNAVEADRGTGDSAFLCADVSLIRSAIGFSSQYSLEAKTASLFKLEH